MRHFFANLCRDALIVTEPGTRVFGCGNAVRSEWHLNFRKSWRGRLIWMERAILAKREL